MLALISKSKSENMLLGMYNFSKREHLTVYIVNVSNKNDLANKNDHKHDEDFGSYQ